MKIIFPVISLAFLLTACGNEPEKQTETQPETPKIKIDIAAGEAAAKACAGCHNSNGISSTAETPHLAGQHAEYLRSAMQAYQDKTRKDEVMATALAELNAQDIANIAGYYASLPGPDINTNPEPVKVAEEPEQAEAEQAAAPAAAAACAGCHGATGVSALPGTPSLAALSKDYLVAATKAYKTQERKDPVMAGMVAALSDADIEAIATFYAEQPLENPSTPASGDATAGEAAAATCAGCHGADGNSGSPNANPSLAGQDATYLAKAMKSYKDGSRDNAVMPGMVAALSDADLENIATFYASNTRHAPGAGGEAEVTREALSAEAWAEKCNRCHGEDGKSERPGYPRLANQRADYTVRALHAYQGDGRDMSTMHKMSLPLMESEIQDIANYYSKR
ncbi:MAG TPA: c-type cytochrome [Chromatiales bacterium]|nr:c-type cytochrome [Thiotrichales bacterium]HIP67247.1 c-type cytochrome [Chromatiales bacterium]